MIDSQPTSIVAGLPISPPVVVRALDSKGQVVADFTGSVTISLATNPSGATLLGVTTQPAVAGVATFSDLSIDKSGTGYQLQATGSGLTSSMSTPIGVTPQAATHFAFASAPTTTAAGSPISPAVQVEVRDPFENVATDFTDTVRIALGANPGGGALSGMLAKAATAGVATFDNLQLDKTGTGYTLQVSGGALPAISSTAFAVVPGPVSPSASTMIATPGLLTASTGSSASTITVTALDVFGNPIQNVSVVLAATGTGNAITQPGPTDSNGVATGTLSSTVAEAKVVSATLRGVAVTQRDTITVNAGAPSALAFTTQPSAAKAAVNVNPPVQVRAQDAFGNTIKSFTGLVTIVIGANPGGGTLRGTTAQSAVAGVATFGDLNIDKAGTGYTLVASATGFSAATSNPFDIGAGAVSAAQSSVVAAPATIAASTGSATSTITVTARDAFGNAVAGVAVTLSATGTGNTLTQPVGVTNAGGVATGTLSSTAVGAKVISAVVSGVPVTQQPTVTVTAGAVSTAQSTIAVAPDTIEASPGDFPATVTVTALDALGNPVPGATVVLAATGLGNAVVQPGKTDSSGIATGTLASSRTGDKVVSATITGALVSHTVTVTVMPSEVSPTLSTVVASPATVAASGGGSVATITVTAFDGLGNLVPGVQVLLNVTGNGNVLTPPSPTTNAQGVASATLASTVVGPKIITAVIDGTQSVETDTVTVTPGPPSSLTFLVQPAGAAVNNTITPPVQVEVLDAFGNPVTTAVTPVTVALGANSAGATLSGGGSVSAVAGVATFSVLSLNKVGTGYTLTASANGLTGATSSPFNITAGTVSASQSTVTVLPASITAGSGTATITVTAKDAGGNAISGAAVSLAVSGSGNTVTQPATPTDLNGVTTGTLVSTATGVKTITATVNGVVLTQKPTVTVTPGAISASVSTVSAAPNSIVSGTGVATITVTVKDANANPISGVTVSLGATGSNNNLVQPAAPTAGNGVATGSLSATSTGSRTISATAGGVALTQTATVTVTSAGSVVVLVGAGDIADCGSTNDEATAAVVSGITGDVITLGDNVYPNGTTSDFKNCYTPSWGAFKSRTHPSAGNHEYNTTGAAPYYAYFGSAAGPSGLGYYSYDIGTWHVIVLNSNISTSAGSTQEQWLKADLAAHPATCTLAYWHHPLYYSTEPDTGTTGGINTSLLAFWNDLYAAGAELVLNGHRHVYERMAPMKPDGSSDPTNGIRELIVGTGGESGGSFTNIFPLSEVREGHTYGVIKLTLSPGSYTWQFIPIAGQTFTDSGSGTCH